MIEPDSSPLDADITPEQIDERLQFLPIFE